MCGTDGTKAENAEDDGTGTTHQHDPAVSAVPGGYGGAAPSSTSSSTAKPTTGATADTTVPVASGSMTVAVPRASMHLLPDFIRLLSSHSDASYTRDSLVKEWGISNSTLEVRAIVLSRCLRAVSASLAP